MLPATSETWFEGQGQAAEETPAPDVAPVQDAFAYLQAGESTPTPATAPPAGRVVWTPEAAQAFTQWLMASWAPPPPRRRSGGPELPPVAQAMNR